MLSALDGLKSGVVATLGAIAGALVCFVAMYLYVHLWTIPAAKREARQGYVLEASLQASQAKAAKAESDKQAANDAIDLLNKAIADQQAKMASQAQFDKDLQDHEKALADSGKSCLLDDDTRGWLSK